MTARLDLPDIRRGDSWSHMLRFWNESKTARLNLTGRTYRAQMRRGPDDDLIATFDIDVTNLLTGELLLSLEPAVTGTIPAGVMYVWDIEEDASGVITTPLAGEVRVVKDVTR